MGGGSNAVLRQFRLHSSSLCFYFSFFSLFSTMPRVPHSVKRIKLMTLAREEQLEASLERNEWIPSESDDDEVKSQKTILEEEVDDEEGDVFLDADCVEETASQASFISKFSFTSTSAPSTPSSSPSPSPPRSCVYTGNSTRTQERRRSSSRSLEKESKSIQSIHSYFSKVSPRNSCGCRTDNRLFGQKETEIAS